MASAGAAGLCSRLSTVLAPLPFTNGCLNLRPVRRQKSQNPAPLLQYPHLVSIHGSWLPHRAGRTFRVFIRTGSSVDQPCFGFPRRLFCFPRRASTVSWQGLGSMHQNLTPDVHPVGEMQPVWPPHYPWQPTHSLRVPHPWFTRASSFLLVLQDKELCRTQNL